MPCFSTVFRRLLTLEPCSSGEASSAVFSRSSFIFFVCSNSNFFVPESSAVTQRLACLLNLFSPSPLHTLQLQISSISNVASFLLSVFPWGTEAQLSDLTDMSPDPARRARRCILYRGNRTSRAPRPKPKVFTQRAEGLNGWREPATSV